VISYFVCVRLDIHLEFWLNIICKGLDLDVNFLFERPLVEGRRELRDYFSKSHLTTIDEPTVTISTLAIHQPTQTRESYTWPSFKSGLP
jgi:hypothetical protein